MVHARYRGDRSTRRRILRSPIALYWCKASRATWGREGPTEPIPTGITNGRYGADLPDSLIAPVVVGFADCGRSRAVREPRGSVRNGSSGADEAAAEMILCGPWLARPQICPLGNPGGSNGQRSRVPLDPADGQRRLRS